MLELLELLTRSSGGSLTVEDYNRLVDGINKLRADIVFTWVVMAIGVVGIGVSMWLEERKTQKRFQWMKRQLETFRKAAAVLLTLSVLLLAGCGWNGVLDSPILNFTRDCATGTDPYENMIQHKQTESPATHVEPIRRTLPYSAW